ncbi:Protein eva-1 -like protein B [Collichthys lucidus]|uniref:Protein eva-1-like protein B n=3 Tax=Sciaenidae TaxID=30870 RepID=A0A4U5V3I8_COLLU|nr:Protein eva-1 -like protein B [Collichthys lucidus]
MQLGLVALAMVFLSSMGHSDALKLSRARRQRRGVKKAKSKINMDVKKKEMDLLSNSIAAYAHIKANPESFGLYFVLGVCFGLVLTLCLLVIRISCKPRTNVAPSTPEKKHLKDISEEEEEESEDDEDEDVEDVEAPVVLPSTEIPVGNHTSQSDGTLSVNVFTSAEELERAQRLEERERIIREIWRNGQPDILGSGTGTIGRVHYY